MKQYLVFLSLVFFNISVQAQEPVRESNGNSTQGMVFHNNENYLQIGFGFPNRLASISGNTANGVSPSVVYSIAFDRGISTHFSVGAYLGFASATWEATGYTLLFNQYYPVTTVHTLASEIILGRVIYHFNFDSPIDFYAGASFGMLRVTETDEASIMSPWFDLQAGGKYFFNKHVGIFGEVALGIAYLNGGFCFKF